MRWLVTQDAECAWALVFGACGTSLRDGTMRVTPQPLGLDCQIQANEMPKRAWSGQLGRERLRS
ncbi:MAG TPA: hypothetical protein DEP84_29840 [Chloroflexi bacterium]|nr:hypothetical protein [Chloroflexota bacterium]